MSRASRKWKAQYHGGLKAYRRERRFMSQEAREVEKVFRDLRNLHRKFFWANPWIPKEKRTAYKYSPEFWDWVYNNVNRYRKFNARPHI